jgi:hypothetical protein
MMDDRVLAHPAVPVGADDDFSGGLVVHLDGSVAGCANDDDIDGGGCVDGSARHTGEPTRTVLAART